jgi:hypothetical protein
LALGDQRRRRAGPADVDRAVGKQPDDFPAGRMVDPAHVGVEVGEQLLEHAGAAQHEEGRVVRMHADGDGV